MSFTIDDLLNQIQPARRRLTAHDSVLLKGDWYGVSAFLTAKEIRSDFADPRPRIRFAEDGCGNCFTVSKSDGRIWFWDHETGNSILMAPNLTAFLVALTKMPEVELEPGQVKSVWIDPEFMKEMKGKGLI
jgi:hypothetical protein